MSARTGRAQASHRASRSEKATAWQRDAACIGLPVDMFYPPPKMHTPPEVRRLCNSCDVQAECLDYALEYAEPHGVWGGLSERQRRQLAQRREKVWLS